MLHFKLIFVSPIWEIRHGAAVALREILKTQCSSAGKTGTVLFFVEFTTLALTSDHSGEVQNQDWLEDCALRLITVLALDQFTDFVSDQVRTSIACCLIKPGCSACTRNLCPSSRNCS